MTTNELDWLNTAVKDAVKTFWHTRNGGKGVLGGKTLHSFLKIIERVVRDNGLPDAVVHTDRQSSQLPGFFRPHKCWDAVVINHGSLVAAIEFKSQVGSIGNNFNNRTEEVLGSGIDLASAIDEQAFGPAPDIFIGYIIVVESGKSTEATPRINMKYFPVMPGFLKNDSKEERERIYTARKDGTLPKAVGISYMNRYDEMCKRLMLKKLYTAAALVKVPNDAKSHDEGAYDHVDARTSIETFMAKLAAHCRVAAAINRQQG